jgi:hypothetical protein
MPMLPIENVGKLGLIQDLKAYELNPEAWSRAINVRFTKDGAQKFDGHQEVYAGALHAPYWLFPWPSTELGFTWLYGGTGRMGRINGNAHSDVTRFTTTLGDDDYSATSVSIWSGTLIGDLPVFTYNGNADPPQAWNAGNGRFEDLPNWQSNSFCDIIATVSDHLVAMRVSRNGTINPRMVKWSQAADPGTYPSSWDETDPATGAGEVTLKQTQGAIQSGAHLNNTFLIYKEDSVISMRFVGGQSVFRFDTVFSEFGAISRHSVAELENSHMVVTETDVLLHNGNTERSVIDDRNRRILFDTLSETYRDKLHVSVDKLNSEVWINYPDTTTVAGELNRALVWNYDENTWSFRELQDFSFSAYGRVDLTTQSRLWDDQGSEPVWNNFVGTWQRQQLLRAYIATDAVNSKFYHMNEGNLLDTVAPMTVLERTGLGIVGRDRDGNWKVDLNSRKFLRALFPKIDSSEPLNIYVGASEAVDGPVNWQGPFPFDANTQTHINCRVNGRFLAVRFESDTDMSWTVYGYTLDMDIIGQATR